LDVVRARANPGDTESLLLNTAARDGKKVRIGFGQDPGQAGKSQALHLVCVLSAFDARGIQESGDKLTRFGPFSSQCRASNVTSLVLWTGQPLAYPAVQKSGAAAIPPRGRAYPERRQTKRKRHATVSDQ
jgi:predicted phage terminase large subunit-like protein